MSFDSSNIPTHGTFLVAAVLYGAASVYAGQIIVDRMIAKAGWHIDCPEGLIEAAQPAPRPKTAKVPERRCSQTLGLFAREFGQLCHEFGDPDFNREARKAQTAIEAQRKAVEERRMARFAASAPTQCGCAANAYKSNERIALALYAGSGRQIALSSIEAQESALREALAAPACQALGGAS